MAERYAKYGKIVDFDRASATGRLEVDGKSLQFPSTCFLGKGRGRWPQKGEQVEVIFRDKEMNEVMVVRVRE